MQHTSVRLRTLCKLQRLFNDRCESIEFGVVCYRHTAQSWPYVNTSEKKKYTAAGPQKRSIDETRSCDVRRLFVDSAKLQNTTTFRQFYWSWIEICCKRSVKILTAIPSTSTGWKGSMTISSDHSLNVIHVTGNDIPCRLKKKVRIISIAEFEIYLTTCVTVAIVTDVR